MAVAQLEGETGGKSCLGHDGLELVEIGVAAVGPDRGVHGGQVEFAIGEIAGLGKGGEVTGVLVIYALAGGQEERQRSADDHRLRQN